MKFTTTITSLFFVLFIFTSTTAFAVNYTTTTGDAKELIDKEDNDNIIMIVGRTAEVTDMNYIENSETYNMKVKVMKGMTMVARASSSQHTLSLNLNNLDAGSYLFIIQTPTGIERRLVKID